MPERQTPTSAMTTETQHSTDGQRGFRFDVFLSHASEDKIEVRALAGQLRSASMSVWLDEEQMPPGFDPQKAIEKALQESRHVLIWITEAWLEKTWTKWELKLFSDTEKNDDRRVVPVLRVPWDNAKLGPYLTQEVAIPPERSANERLWLAVCGVRGEGPGPRDTWSEQGRELAEGSNSTEVEHRPTSSSTTGRLKIAYQRRKSLTISGADTTEIDREILDLRRELRNGPTLHAGEFLSDGRFELVEEIGQGGFATVWKAYDEKTKQLVAIKVLHGRFAKDRSRRDRMFRGARRMAELQHPHVVRVLVSEGEEQGFYYYVMEYVAGGDLYKGVIEKRVDTERALYIVESIAGALEAAHERGLVHRDVKPQNILLHADGTPALTDFDLVQAKDTTGGTGAGAMGTVIYAAPEQNEDARGVDRRADIYSLGMTALFCIHGRRLPLSIMRQLDVFLAKLSCDEALREFLRNALAIQPRDRFNTMMSFRVALIGALRAVREPDASGRFVVEKGGYHYQLPTQELLLGTTIAGRYRVDMVLGTGTISTVFRGHHVGLKRDVAIKVLHPHMARDPQVSKRFDQEAHSISRLDHPNCVRVSDVGSTDYGVKFMVMDLLVGAKLADRMGHPIPDEQAILMVLQALRGLEHAHKHGVVHRDIKPENIFVTRDYDGREVLKLVDFGIAKLVERESAKRDRRGIGKARSRTTKEGQILGTLCYAAPEQIMGEEADLRDDIYAVGVILYEMLSGAPPFEHDDPVKLVRMQVYNDPPPLPQSVAPALSEVVMRLLAKERGDRYQSATEAAEALEFVLPEIVRSLPVQDLMPVNDEEGPVVGKLDSAVAVSSIPVSASDEKAPVDENDDDEGDDQYDYYEPAPVSIAATWIIALVILLLGGGITSLVMMGDESKPFPPEPEVLGEVVQSNPNTVFDGIGADDDAATPTAIENTDTHGIGTNTGTGGSSGDEKNDDDSEQSDRKDGAIDADATNCAFSSNAPGCKVVKSGPAPVVPGTSADDDAETPTAIDNTDAVSTGTSIDAVGISEGEKAADDRDQSESNGRAIDADATNCVFNPNAPGCGGNSEDTSPKSFDATLPDKLSNRQMARALRSNRNKAKKTCGPKHGASPGEVVRVRLSIDGSTGKVLTAKAKKPHNNALGKCVVHILKKTEFPRFTDAQQGTTYPLTF